MIGKVGTVWGKLAQLPRLVSASPVACETPFPHPPPQPSPTVALQPQRSSFLTPTSSPNVLQVSTTFFFTQAPICFPPCKTSSHLLIPLPPWRSLSLPSYPWGHSFLNCKKLKVTLWWGLKFRSWGSDRKLTHTLTQSWPSCQIASSQSANSLTASCCTPKPALCTLLIGTF